MFSSDGMPGTTLQHREWAKRRRIPADGYHIDDDFPPSSRSGVYRHRPVNKAQTQSQHGGTDEKPTLHSGSRPQPADCLRFRVIEKRCSNHASSGYRKSASGAHFAKQTMLMPRRARARHDVVPAAITFSSESISQANFGGFQKPSNDVLGKCASTLGSQGDVRMMPSFT